LIDRRISIVKDVIISPAKAFSEIGKNGNYFFVPSLIILAGFSIFQYLNYATLFSSSLPGLEEVPDFFEVQSILYSIVSDFTLAFFIFIVGRWFAGKATFTGMFSTLQYAFLPIEIATGIIFAFLGQAMLSAAVDVENFLTQFVPMMLAIIPISIWGIILVILACREAHQISTLKSIGVLILAGIISSVIAIAMTFAFMPDFMEEPFPLENI